MNCEEIRSLLDAYADRELDVVRSLEIERHLAECPACRHRYEGLQALTSTVKNGSLYFEAPPALERRIRGALRGNGTIAAERRPARVSSYTMFQRPLAMAASVAFLVIGTWIVAARLSAPSTEDLVARELIGSHVRSLMVNHLADVASSDQHTVKPWFDGKVDFSPPVEDFAAQGFTLIGGRLDYIDGKSVAALVYHHRKHFINLFIWPSAHGPEGSENIMSRQGYYLIHWTKSGLDYWAVSNLNEGELRQFAHLVRSEG